MSNKNKVQTTDSKALSITEKLNDNSQFLEAINANYPVSVQENFSEIVNILDEEKQITELYPEILAEIPISTSQFQDQCVQYEQHFTAHRKLRQALLELQDKFGALYSAKTGNKKALLRVEKIKLKIEELTNQLEALETGENIDGVNDLSIKKLKVDILMENVKLEEKQRAYKSSTHLVKDAMIKVSQHQSLIKKFEAEVVESNLSFEQSEVQYYVMYFTYDVEKQLRTMGRIDTGTFGAIGNLPEQIRLKVMNNISFLRKKIFDEKYPIDGDHLSHVYFDLLKPEKTGDDEMEGLCVGDFIVTESIKLLAKGK